MVEHRLRQQFLVAHLVEEHGDPIPFVGQYHPAAPLLVLDPQAGPERPGRARRGRPARVAVVAAEARVVRALAEVAEQEAPPAGGHFGVAAHHLDPGPFDRAVLAGGPQGPGGGLGRPRGVRGRVGASAGRGPSGPGPIWPFIRTAPAASSRLTSPVSRRSDRPDRSDSSCTVTGVWVAAATSASSVSSGRPPLKNWRSPRSFGR